MPIKLKPVQVRGSLYILIPKTITQLFNISKKATFILSVEEHENILDSVNKNMGIEKGEHEAKDIGRFYANLKKVQEGTSWCGYCPAETGSAWRASRAAYDHQPRAFCPP